MLLLINWVCQTQLLAATFRIPTKDTKIQNCNVERAIQRLVAIVAIVAKIEMLND